MPSSSTFSYDTTADVRLSDIVSQALGWVRRNFVWLVLGSLVGAGLSVALNMSRPKQYTSSFIGVGNNLDDIRIREIVEHLNVLKVTGEIPELARRLKLTEDEARRIDKIRGLTNNILEAELPTYPPRPHPEENFRYPFGMEATVTDPELFPKLQEGIVNYIDQLPSIRKRLDEQRASLRRRVEQDEKEIAYLQNLKQSLLERPDRINVMDIGTVSRHIVDINDRLEQNRLELADLEHEVIITRPMEVVRKPSSPGPYRAAASGGAFGLAATLGLLALLAIIRLSKQK